jgi:hypothetical protein
MSPFQQALQNAANGTLKTPEVSIGEGTIDYFMYQLAIHKYNLSLMAKGIKFRNITFTQIKKYYGLKGRTAAGCLPQFEQLISDYKTQVLA